jgi:hypothetical protein
MFATFELIGIIRESIAKIHNGSMVRIVREREREREDDRLRLLLDCFQMGHSPGSTEPESRILNSATSDTPSLNILCSSIFHHDDGTRPRRRVREDS